MNSYYAPAIKGGKTVLIPVLRFLEVCEVGNSPSRLRALCADEAVVKFQDEDTTQYRIPFYNYDGELNALVVNEFAPGYEPSVFGVLLEPEKGVGFKTLEVGGRYYAPKWENFAGGRQLFMGEPRY